MPKSNSKSYLKEKMKYFFDDLKGKDWFGGRNVGPVMHGNHNMYDEKSFFKLRSYERF